MSKLLEQCLKSLKRSYSSSEDSGRTDDAEANTVISLVRDKLITASRAAILRFILPGSTAPHSGGICIITEPGAAVGWVPFVSFVPMVLAPFPDVAVHVVEAEVVGVVEAADLSGFAERYHRVCDCSLYFRRSWRVLG